MQNTSQRLIPGWVWALLAVALVALTLVLFMTDRSPEPGAALVYDVSEFEAVADDDIRYRETGRIALALDTPTGLAAAEDNRLFVVGDDVLLVLDRSGREQARHVFGGRPHCVAVAPDHVVYIGMRDRVKVFSESDGLSAAWAPLDEQAWLTSIAADDRYVFVADAGNRRVLRYDRTGGVVNEIGGRTGPENAPRFIVPSYYLDVLPDGMGALWITNPGRLGIEKYRMDGELLGAWHQPGMAVDKFAGCCNPIHAALKSDGSLVTAEKGLNRVKVFNADRSFAGVVAAPEMLNAGWSAADFPPDPAPIRDLAVDPDDRILVLHGPLRAVLVFEPLPEGEESP